jgi:hypothetical protein
MLNAVKIQLMSSFVEVILRSSEFDAHSQQRIARRFNCQLARTEIQIPILRDGRTNYRSSLEYPPSPFAMKKIELMPFQLSTGTVEGIGRAGSKCDIIDVSTSCDHDLISCEETEMVK